MFNSKSSNAFSAIPLIVSLASGVAALSLMAPQASAQAAPVDTIDEIAQMPRIAYEQFSGHRGLINPGAHTSRDDTFASWLSITTADAEFDMPVQTSRAHTSLDGAVLGGEARLMSDFIIGGALSVGETTAEFASGGRYALEGGSLSVYGAYESDLLGLLSLTLTKGGHKIDNVSRISGAATNIATGETDTSFWDVTFAARSNDELGPFEIDHGITLATGHVQADGFVETAATGTGFEYQDQAFNYRLVSLDATVRTGDWSISDAIVLRPFADMIWTYQFGDDDYGLRYQTAGGTGPFTTLRANAPADNLYGFGVGADLSLGDNWMLTARYGRQWADDRHDSDEAMLTLRAVF